MNAFLGDDQRADTVATKFLAFVVFFFGAQLSYSSFSEPIEPRTEGHSRATGFGVTILSIVVKVALAFLLWRSGRNSNSGMMVANAKNMRNDVVISVVVLLGLVFTQVLNVGMIDLILVTGGPLDHEERYRDLHGDQHRTDGRDGRQDPLFSGV